jgi:lysophospholipase L1-like esterase
LIRQILQLGGDYLRLKRFSVLFIVILALSTLFSSIGSAEKNDRQNLVALGDSITFGYHLEPNQTQPSPNAFPRLIANGSFNVTNLGVPGWTSADLLNALKTNPAFKRSLKSADIVTVDIGNNDLIQATGLSQLLQSQTPVVLTPELQQKLAFAELQFAGNLAAIIMTIKKQTDAPIILYNLYNPFGASTNPFLGSLHIFGEQIITAVNSQVINPIAIKTGSHLADAYTAFNGHQATFIIPGDIHPTLAGHQALAKLADQALLKLNLNLNLNRYR